MPAEDRNQICGFPSIDLADIIGIEAAIISEERLYASSRNTMSDEKPRPEPPERATNCRTDPSLSTIDLSSLPYLMVSTWAISTGVFRTRRSRRRKVLTAVLNS